MKPKGIKIAVAAALAVAPAAARAQTAVPNQPIVPLGFCQLASLGSAVGLSSCSRGIPAGATMAAIRVEGAAVGYLDDGAAPTAIVGSGHIVGWWLPPKRATLLFSTHPCAFISAPQVICYWQAEACLRAAHETATCRSLRSPTGSSDAIGWHHPI